MPPPTDPTLQRYRRAASSAVAAVTIALAAPSPAAGDEPAAPRGTFNLLIENDLIAGTDRHYTHGLQARWLSGADDVPGWVRELGTALPLFAPKAALRVSYALGQSIFTPDDIGRAELIADDRPYAGWLYGGIGLVGATPERIDTLELDLGVVGPASLAEPVQKRWHALIKTTRPQGWDHQLGNEPGVVLYYERKWRRFQRFPFAGLQGDLMPHLGAAAGNVFTYGAGGLTLRLGNDLAEDFGAPRIQPALPGSGFFVADQPFGWYLFAGVEGRAVARNIFLDGSTFADSHSVDKRPLVGDFQVGLALTLGPVRLTYSHIFRTREFDGQDEPDSFGALSLALSF
jgi:hypothetical protein